MKKDQLKEAFSLFLDKHFSGSKDNHKEVVESEQELVKSVDEMERRALFVVLEPQESLGNVSDKHGDYYDEIAIEKACIAYNKHSRKLGVYHAALITDDHATVEQSFINPSTFTTEDGIEIKKGSWLMWMHFPKPENPEDDLLWPDVLAGEFTGVSVECSGKGYEFDE